MVPDGKAPVCQSSGGKKQGMRLILWKSRTDGFGCPTNSNAARKGGATLAVESGLAATKGCGILRRGTPKELQLQAA